MIINLANINTGGGTPTPSPTPTTEYSDIDGMKYQNCRITSFPSGWKFAPREGENSCYEMFKGCKWVTEIPGPLDISKCPYIYNMFYNCYAVTKVPELDCSAAIEAGFMFSSCKALTSITLKNTGNITDFGGCFYDCTALKTLSKLDVAGYANTTSLPSDMFQSCTALTDFGGFENLTCNVNISNLTNLSKQSLLNIINLAGTVSGRTLTLGATNLAKLTDAEKKIATDKGWTLA